MTRRLAPAFLSALLCLAARAEGPLFIAQADRTQVAMDQVLTVRVTLSGGDLGGARPVPPEMTGFRASFAGQSQNISFVNGRVSNEVSYTYVLQPLSPGDHAIPPFTARVDGKTLSTEPLPVKVVAASTAPGAMPAENAGDPAPTKDLFLTASVDKAAAVVGEAVTLSVRFHSRVPLLSQPSYAPPPLTGFLSEDLPPHRQFVETIQGRRYTVIELKTALFPAAPGTAVVGPAALECRTDDFSDDAGGDPFGSAFFRNFFAGGRSVTLNTPPLKVAVSPLPAAGRPAGFQGDVGRYRLTAALDRPRAALHEPVTLTVTISGEGNVKSLSAPALPALPGFKTYETLSSLNIDKTGWKVRGSKAFKTVLKPEVSGRLQVPPIVLSYYDPETRAYKTAVSEPLFLEVAPGEAAAPGASPATGVKVLDRDIRYLKPGPPERARPRLHRSRLFWPLNLLPLLVFLCLWSVQAWRARPAGDPSSDAARRARRALKRISSLPPGEAFAALEGALREYWAAKSGTAAAAVSAEEMARTLSAQNADPAVSRDIKRLWEELYRSRYAAAAATPAAAAAAAADLARLLPALEALWKR